MTVKLLSAILFQSTLSVRRATRPSAPECLADLISIHALRKESDMLQIHAGHLRTISIHALRKESDQQVIDKANNLLISIHALRKESD